MNAWLYAVVVTLAAFRITRLVGWDEITQPIRAWLSGVHDRGYNQLAKAIEEAKSQGVDPWDGQRRPPPLSERRYYVAKLLHCPWCVGFWISLAAALAADEWHHTTYWISVPFAISAVVGLIAKNLDP